MRVGAVIELALKYFFQSFGNGKRKRATDAAADTGAGDIKSQDKDYVNLRKLLKQGSSTGRISVKNTVAKPISLLKKSNWLYFSDSRDFEDIQKSNIGPASKMEDWIGKMISLT